MKIDILHLRLSALRALLGNVSDKLRAVAIDTHENTIKVNFFYDGEISDDDQECYAHTMDQIIADFWTSKDGSEPYFYSYIDRLDYPQKIPEAGILVYKRYEE